MISIRSIVCVLLPALAWAADWPAPPASVAEVQALAASRNPVVRQVEGTAAGARALADAARSARAPRLDAKTRYSVAEGGRTIDFPAGDLLNPVYGTLGRITGRPADFPTLGNQDIAFLRETEQETKLAATLPLFRPSLGDQARSARLEADRAETGTALARRTIRGETAIALYRTLSAGAAVDILASAGSVLETAWKTTEALVREGRATPDAAARAKAERLGVDQQRREAEQLRETARGAFNLLLDEPLDRVLPVIDEADWSAYAERLIAWSNTLHAAERIERREEVAMARTALAAARVRVAAARGTRLPAIDLAGEYGWQGEQFDFDGEHDYGIVSVVADLPLFDGRDRRSRIAAARAEASTLEAALAVTRRQVELEIDDASRAFRVAQEAVPVARERAEAARLAFESAAANYREGRIPLIHFLDARDAMTRAQLDVVATRSRLFIAAAALERAALLDASAATRQDPP